jgi:hypothetical protein
MLDGLTYDDSEPPSIALVPAGTSWEEVRDHMLTRTRRLMSSASSSGSTASCDAGGTGAGSLTGYPKHAVRSKDQHLIISNGPW